MEVEKIMQELEQKHPGELEYLQAVREVLLSIKDVYNQHPEFEKAKLIERLVEPERGFFGGGKDGEILRFLSVCALRL